jgi:hypothetical protein
MWVSENQDNPLGWTIIDWLHDNFIPAIEALRDGDWATAWNSLGGKASNEMILGFINDIANLPGTVGDAFRNLFAIPKYDWNGVPGGGSSGGSGSGGFGGPDENSSGWWDWFQNFAPQGIAPGASTASIAGMGSTTTTTINHLTVPITFNAPVTQENARMAAQTVDDVPRQRGWAPT